MGSAVRSQSAVVYVVFFMSLLLLLSLGGWQWRRGVEKAAIEALLESPLSQYSQYITLDRSPPNWSDIAYRQVRLEGEWRTAPVFLLANRIHRGQPGYEVLSPFRLAGDGSTLLVNRGWSSHTDHAPSAGLRQPPAVVTGQLYLPQKGVVLGPAHTAQPDDPPQQPTVIQYFDAPALSALLGGALQPAVVALDANHPRAFERTWQPYAMNATRHFGYAAQWWGLAATLLVFGFIWRRQAQRPPDPKRK